MAIDEGEKEKTAPAVRPHAEGALSDAGDGSDYSPDECVARCSQHVLLFC